jgi:hypothetical protein
MRAVLATSAAVIVASVATVGFGQARPSTIPSLEGVWMSTSVTGTGPNAANSISDRQPNLNIWTKRYFSRVQADGPTRPVLAPPKVAGKLTNAEKLERYEHFRPFVAVAGVYEVKGTQWFQYPFVGKDQTADILERNKTGNMTFASTPVVGQEIKFEGNTLVLIQTANGTRRTYRRLDQPQSAGTKPSPIEGVWKLASSVQTGATAAANPHPLPNLYIYKAGYYAFLTQDGASPSVPRVLLAPAKDAANLTDAEKLARYEHWAPGAAQTGRYEMKGATLYRYPLVAKNQGADIIERNKTGNLGNPALNAELVFSNGNNTMVRITRSADGKSETRQTYTRLE